MIRIFCFQGSQGERVFFVPLYKNNAKNGKSSRKKANFTKSSRTRNHDIITIDYYMDEYAYVNKLRQFIMTQLESKQESIVSEQ